MSDIRVGIYLRVSTEAQAYRDRVKIEDGSIEQQRKRVQDYLLETCSQRNVTYKVVREFEDLGVSAGSVNRPAYQAMWKAIAEKQIEWIVVSDLSRINRNTRDFLNLEEHCKDNGVKLLASDTAYAPKTPEGELFQRLKMNLAEYERNLTSVRLKRNIITRLKSDGKINGATTILGLDSCPNRRGHFVINAEEVETLKRLLSLYLESSSQAETLRKATSSGIRDKDGRELSEFRLKNIIENVDRRYSGVWYGHDSSKNENFEVPLDHGPVLPKELVEKVKRKRENAYQKKLRCGKRDHIYLLSSLLKSLEGHNFEGRVSHGRSKTYRYYYCRKSKVRITAEEVESVIEKRVIEYFKKSSIFKRLLQNGQGRKKSKEDKIQNEMSRLLKEHTDIGNKIDNLVDHLASMEVGDSAVGTISKKIDDLERRREQVNGELERRKAALEKPHVVDQVTDAQTKIAEYAKRFKDLKRMQKRQLLEEIFEKIEVLDQYSIKLHIKKKPLS